MSSTGKIREPKQERSIETKNNIIAAGYEVFSTVGYYGTNTAEIAKVAGVSTGIVYGYFRDKRDILLCVLKIYIETITKPIYEITENLASPVDVNALVKSVVDEVIKIHEENARLHNTLHSLAASDDGVEAQFSELEKDITVRISKSLTDCGLNSEHMFEKVHLAMNMLQSFAHEYVFDKHQYIDYAAMRKTVCSMIAGLFA